MSISVALFGCDGSVWDLSTGADGATLANGVNGLLHLPKVTQLYTKTARRSGQTWRGSRLESRAFSMKVNVGDRTPPLRVGDDWMALDAAFWSALSTDEPAQLVVNGRSLTFRLDDGNDAEQFADDPSLFGFASYTIDCVADRPEWVGAPVTATFPYVATAGSNFFGGGSGTKGPPFYISASSALATASVANPGDLPAWPVWTITGPISTATVGVVGQTISLPFPLRTGDVVIVNTGLQTITDPQGTNLWPQMGYADVEFAPVPAGDSVPVVVGMGGGGSGASIKVELTPLFRRAW